MVAKTTTKIISAKNKNAVALAAEVLEKGGVIAFPTETAYGLGALATNKKAVERVFELKGRPRQKALPVIAGDLRVMERYAFISDLERCLARKFMPGPLTLVVQRKNSLLPAVAASDGSVAFRIPGSEFALALCKAVKAPITATSANPSGTSPPYGVKRVKKHFMGKVDLILDGGKLRRVPPSTIFDVRGEVPLVLRGGPIPASKIFGEIDAFRIRKRLKKKWRRKRKK